MLDAIAIELYEQDPHDPTLTVAWCRQGGASPQIPTPPEIALAGGDFLDSRARSDR